MLHSFLSALIKMFGGAEMKEVKVSYHNQTARNTAGHNDRSSYGKSRDYGGDKRKNRHWDCYGCRSSVDAERQFYEEHFHDVLVMQNENYLRNRHAEKVKNMDEYMKAHPVRESIIQLGDKDSDIPPGYLERVAPILYGKMEDVGCYLISMDVHNDKWVDDDGDVHEATPHLHVRWMGIDSNGKPNVAGALREHGVPLPKPGKRAGKYNNELITFTAEVRELLEDEARDYLAELGVGYELNTERDTNAIHLEPEAFRLKKKAEERELDLLHRELQLEVDEELMQYRRELDDLRNGELRVAAMDDCDLVVASAEAELSELYDEYDELSHEMEAKRLEAEAEVEKIRRGARWEKAEADDVLKSAERTRENARRVLADARDEAKQTVDRADDYYSDRKREANKMFHDIENCIRRIKSTEKTVRDTAKRVKYEPRRIHDIVDDFVDYAVEYARRFLNDDAVSEHALWVVNKLHPQWLKDFEKQGLSDVDDAGQYADFHVELGDVTQVIKAYDSGYSGGSKTLDDVLYDRTPTRESEEYEISR